MSPDLETLLSHAEFVRRIARSLVREDQVDDVVQETWSAALRSPPGPKRRLRPWLGRVARNAARMLLRGESRRRRYEHAGARRGATLSPAEMVARAEVHRKLVEAVLDLSEPYRFTLLLRYFEDLPPRDIARRADVPVETVRVRLRRALRQLRGRLDRLHDDDRRAWSLALLPLTGVQYGARTSSGPVVAGATIMGKKMVLITVGAAVAGSALTLMSVNREKRVERTSTLTEEVASLRASLDRTRSELARTETARDALAKIVAGPRPGRQEGAIPGSRGGRSDSEARRQRVAELRAQIDAWFARGDGKAALKALRELVTLDPEGWPLAAELWTRIEYDIGDKGRLGFRRWVDVAAYLEAPAMRALMSWGIDGGEAPSTFREAAAHRLPWIQPPDQTLAQFVPALEREKEKCCAGCACSGAPRLTRRSSTCSATPSWHRRRAPTSRCRSRFPRRRPGQGTP